MQDLVAFLTRIRRRGDRRKLRYITMKGHGVELLSEEPMVYKRSWLRPYDLRALTAALDSFPALQLDTLTFENQYWHVNPSRQVDGIAYQVVMYLIRAKKFPQLRHRIETTFRTKRVTPTTVMARQSGPPFETEKELCALLPFWDNLFNDRHGADAGAGVELLGCLSDDGDECYRPLQGENEFTCPFSTTLSCGDEFGALVNGWIEIRITRGRGAK
ncbi:hypothetical protein XANCAGTX0491_005565 [Xanthoria calcicola]